VGVDGILNLIKPPGKTSFEMVALVRRGSGERRVGHAGTLDPLACGVLPICLGQGTRVVEFLAEASKTYRAEIELGVTTDSYDAAGRVTQRCDPSFVTKEHLEKALEPFRGSIEQCPPMFSAIKYKGKPLYQLARIGVEVERKKRRVEVFHLELVDWQLPFVTIEVECSKGGYIRSLAHDLGQTLGCGAHLRSLIRLKYGLFNVEDGIDLSQLEDAFRYRYLERFLYPIDSVLLHWKAAIVGGKTECMVRNGRSLSLEGEEVRASCGYSSSSSGGVELCRAYSPDGHFLAVLRWEEEKELWHPDKVFSHCFTGAASVPSPLKGEG
jgi:tRNA pseudouridine55 synthase